MKFERMSIGARMKENYEFPYQLRLPRRMPMIIRIDGKAFHTLTKDMEKPFAPTFISWMKQTAQKMAAEIQNCELAYCQSDEISFLVHNYKRLESSAWFDNELQKIASITAGLASAHFTHISWQVAAFDARVFVLPEEEVNNYFIWRQEDAIRNSTQMLAQSLYDHKELVGKGKKQLLEMIEAKGSNWHKLETYKKLGYCVKRNEVGQWTLDNEIPEFKVNRRYVENLLVHE